ncbi:MAG: BatA and WFA domain-containing protein [Candidatus Metalachnospira sp.]|nr:BatA and WFA domain-containing protein [Candidatus Metalachnospira sp.]
MGFFNTLGLIALIGVPTILILHMLKRKQRDVRIPSIFLWDKAADTSVQSKPWQKLKKSLPLILQIVAAAAVGLAAARPYITAFGTAYNYIIVVDASSSMSTNDMDKTRFENAKERADKLIGSASALSSITVVAACNNPYVVYGPESNKTEAQTALSSIKQTYGGIDNETLEGIIASEAAKTEAGVYVFTDNDKDFADIDANVFYSGKDTSNCAVTLASASDGNVLVNVKNYGNADAEKTVTVYADNLAAALSEITIPAGQEKSLVFENVYKDSAEITVSLSPEDILSADDTYYLSVNKALTSKILLVSDGNTFLENAIKLTEGTELYKMSSDTMATTTLTGYDLYIFDGVLPEEMPTDGGIFVLNPPTGNSFISTGESVELNTYAKGDTELSSDGNIEFIVSKAKTVTRPSWAVTECAANSTPLIIRGENNGQKVCVFTFDLHDSDLPLLKDFPVMIYNLTDYFLPGRTGESAAAFCGEKLNTAVNASAEKITVTNPEGNERTVAPPFPAADYSETDEPGFYTVSVYDSEGNINETSLAVNDKTDGESELSALFGQDKEGSMGTASKGGAAIMDLLIIIAVVALLMEWWVKYHGIKR